MVIGCRSWRLEANDTGKPIPEPDPTCERWLVVSPGAHIHIFSGNSSAVLSNPIDDVPVGLSRRPHNSTVHQKQSSGEQGDDRSDARILSPRPSIRRRDRGLRD
jgi:hypothetical protein